MWHLRLVKTDVGQHLAVGAEIEGTAVAELLFVHPVGDAVQHVVELSVGSHLRLAAVEEQFHEVQVIVSHKGYEVAVGREEGYLLGASFAQWRECVVLYRIYVVLGCEGVAVDGGCLCLYENAAFVGRHDVALHPFQVLASGCFHVEDYSGLLSCLERVFHNPFPIGAYLCIVQPVGQWVYSVDAAGTQCAFGYFPQRGGSLCHTRQGNEAERNE